MTKHSSRDANRGVVGAFEFLISEVDSRPGCDFLHVALFHLTSGINGPPMMSHCDFRSRKEIGNRLTSHSSLPETLSDSSVAIEQTTHCVRQYTDIIRSLHLKENGEDEVGGEALCKQMRQVKPKGRARTVLMRAYKSCFALPGTSVGIYICS